MEFNLPLLQVDYTSDLLPENRRWKGRDMDLTVEKPGGCYLNRTSMWMLHILRGCGPERRSLVEFLPPNGSSQHNGKKPQTNPNWGLFYKTVNQAYRRVTRSEKTRWKKCHRLKRIKKPLHGWIPCAPWSVFQNRKSDNNGKTGKIWINLKFIECMPKLLFLSFHQRTVVM